MHTNNQPIPLSKNFFPGLLPLIGQKQYERVLERYYDLYSKHSMPENTILRNHLVQGILPGLAYYQLLREEGKTQEAALEKIDQVFEELFSKSVQKFKRLGRLPFFYAILRMVIKPAMKEYPADGWEMVWRQVDGSAIRFRMNSCFYFKTLSDYGAPELAASYCRVDDLIYGGMSSQVLWQRTQTIARGAKFCDFCFANPRKAAE